jgi:hypothetical protein
LSTVGTKMGALESACWYWNSRNINSAADVGDIVKMTKLVNGGTIGLEDRKHHYERALDLLRGRSTLLKSYPLWNRCDLGSDRRDGGSLFKRRLGLASRRRLW